MLEELCRKLKQRRKELALDLEEVVEKTKLHPSTIKSIEAGDISNINAIYLKGYLKIYASFLGVEIKDELTDIVVKKEPKKPIRVRPQPKKEKTQPVRFLDERTKKMLMVAAIAVLLVIVATSFIRFTIRFIGQQITNLSKERTHQETPKEVEAAAPMPEPAVTHEVKDITVSLQIKRDCFVRVKRDAKIVFEGVLRKGVVESWVAKKELEFKISDGSSVDLEVNGQLYSPLSKIRKPIKSLRITAQGIFTDK